jgi:hypothetical protein
MTLGTPLTGAYRAVHLPLPLNSLFITSRSFVQRELRMSLRPPNPCNRPTKKGRAGLWPGVPATREEGLQPPRSSAVQQTGRIESPACWDLENVRSGNLRQPALLRFAQR